MAVHLPRIRIQIAQQHGAITATLIHTSVTIITKKRFTKDYQHKQVDNLYITNIQERLTLADLTLEK